ncbi:IclR family transcriptional regulator [Microbacterium sp. No. 7]|uniref:IclR family transcriptional regulator n=1 Tax=Microbacterium sp. No. 7 TaxID=1714373 RepID=UPI0006D07CCB|nr:IclR family transcriptional regulator [Microbacterium sp. No. 7]ALJ21304.1 IclR family transcriptional regulator [Microbacterium sp. No. 7]
MTDTGAQQTSRASTVQSVARSFELLECIAAQGGDAPISDLAEATRLPLPTIHRLLHTLMASGHVRQLPNRRYGLGPRLIRLGEVASRQVGAWARPHLAGLVEELGETANMAILDGDMATYVAQVPSTHTMRMFTEVGRRVHTHASGVGKAILSQLDDADVRALTERAGMPTPTVHTISDVDALLADLATTRTRGYAIDDNEQELGVRCFAVPVRGMPAPTAISVSGPVMRVDEAFARRAIPILTVTAKRIASETRAESRLTDAPRG